MMCGEDEALPGIYKIGNELRHGGLKLSFLLWAESIPVGTNGHESPSLRGWFRSAPAAGGSGFSAPVGGEARPLDPSADSSVYTS
jgi:hypothetical protein